MEMSEKLSELIKGEYKSEAECARSIGWSRQRLNKLVKAVKEPDINEVDAIARAVKKPIEEVAAIFLMHWSPNEQQLRR